MKKSIYFSLLALMVFVWGCGPDPVTPTEKGTLKIEFAHKAGTQALILGTGIYTNAAGDTLTFKKFDYYLSNIQLKKADGSVYAVPKDSCYYLVKSSKAASQIIDLSNIPAGEYTSMSFIPGVDSAKNMAPAAEHVGVLDPSNGMYWTWNTGHIFMKIEGDSPQAAGGKFTYHIAGSGGTPSAPTYNNVKLVTVPFSQKLVISAATAPELHIDVNVLKFFEGTMNFSVSDYGNITDTNEASHRVVDNFSGMFIFDKIH